MRPVIADDIDDRRRHDVRQVTDTRDNLVVLHRWQGPHLTTETLPKIMHRLQRRFVRFCHRRNDAGGVVEQIAPGGFDAGLLRTGHRMRPDKFWKQRA